MAVGAPPMVIAIIIIAVYASAALVIILLHQAQMRRLNKMIGAFPKYLDLVGTTIDGRSVFLGLNKNWPREEVERMLVGRQYVMPTSIWFFPGGLPPDMF